MRARDAWLIPLVPPVALALWLVYGPVGNWLCGGDA